MFYKHALSTSLREQILADTSGYYAVFVLQQGSYKRHVIKASSDFDAALKVKQMTGVMPKSEKDVVGPLPSSSHGYDKMTRDIWMGR